MTAKAIQAAQIRQLLKNSISVTYPSTKALHCCVMSGSDGNWFAFFPTTISLDERREIEESVYKEMMGGDCEED